MKIGVDASILAEPKTGVGHYVAETLQQMARQRPRWHFYLYAHVPLTCSPRGDNVIFRLLPAGSKITWMQYTLPRALAADDITLLWGGNYHLPLQPGRQKKVLTVHDLVFRRYPFTLPLKRALHLRAALPLYINRADHILTVSQSSAQEIAAAYACPPEKITVTPPAARAVFHEAAAGAFPGGPVHQDGAQAEGYLLYVGTIEPRKGIDTLMRALCLHSNEGGTFPQLILAGKIGWKAGPVMKQIKQETAGGRVRLAGYVPETQLAALYRHAALVIYPSRYEGFGMPVVEAMATGTPVIAGDCPALRETGGDAVIYVSPDDEVLLANAISKVLNDPDLQAEMIARGKQRAGEFSWQQTAEKTIQVFSQLTQ